MSAARYLNTEMLDHVKRLFAKERNEKCDGEVHDEGCVIETLFLSVGKFCLQMKFISICIKEKQTRIQIENIVT